MDLERFCISMATLLNFSKILFSPDVKGPALHMPLRFRPDLPRNLDGVRASGHKSYSFHTQLLEIQLSMISHYA